VVKEVSGGKFEGGFHVFGLDKGGVGYSLDDFNKSMIPPELLNKVEEAKQQIIDGKIKVTDAMAQ
jgi:basic membrane protein A